MHPYYTPSVSQIDHDADAAERHDAHVRARMHANLYRADLLEALKAALEDDNTVLGETVGHLFQCPIRDRYDQKAYLAARDRSDARLGASVRRLISEVSLEHYREADDAAF
jgi:hypothetical protein